jgi:hypothetical protein
VTSDLQAMLCNPRIGSSCGHVPMRGPGRRWPRWGRPSTRWQAATARTRHPEPRRDVWRTWTRRTTCSTSPDPSRKCSPRPAGTGCSRSWLTRTSPSSPGRPSSPCPPTPAQGLLHLLPRGRPRPRPGIRCPSSTSTTWPASTPTPPPPPASSSTPAPLARSRSPPAPRSLHRPRRHPQGLARRAHPSPPVHVWEPAPAHRSKQCPAAADRMRPGRPGVRSGVRPGVRAGVRLEPHPRTHPLLHPTAQASEARAASGAGPTDPGGSPPREPGIPADRRRPRPASPPAAT